MEVSDFAIARSLIPACNYLSVCEQVDEAILPPGGSEIMKFDEAWQPGQAYRESVIGLYRAISSGVQDFIGVDYINELQDRCVAGPGLISEVEAWRNSASALYEKGGWVHRIILVIQRIRQDNGKGYLGDFEHVWMQRIVREALA